MSFICFNGSFLPSTQPVLTVGNSSFKWGDGLFETIRVSGQRILLEEYHFDRLFQGLKLLKMDHQLQAATLSANIQTLCEHNKLRSARIRLEVFRDEPVAGYCIEAVPLEDEIPWNEKGLTLGIYPFARKQVDAFANLKTTSFQQYIMAGRYAKEKGLDEVLLLNTDNRLCDTSKANIFLVKKDEFYTPALTEGCVNGTMHRFTGRKIKEMGFALHQHPLHESDLLEADECFLTNAITGIQWVASYHNKIFTSGITRKLYDRLIPMLLQ
jgi:branched-chain amino acid aminotransferase